MGSGFARLLSALLALAAILTGGWTWLHRLESRVDTLGAEVSGLKSELATLAAHVQEARSIQPRFDLALKEPKLLSHEITLSGWTPALRSLRESAGPDILLQNIRAMGSVAGAKSCELRIEGILIGPLPRVAADRFRTTLQQRLELQFRSPVSTRFDRLELPETSSNSPQRVAFAITATVAEPAQPEPPTRQGS
jgi:hypothetical protein